MIKKKNENLQPASAENKKKFLKGFKKGVACFLLGAGILGLSHTASQQIKYRAFFNDLTTNEQMTDLATKMGVNKDTANLESPRVVFPRNGVLTINVKVS